jgi:hypothetical protein
MDEEGHLAYQDGKPLPGLCHCAQNEAHDIEPTAPAPPEPGGGGASWTPPPGCQVTVSLPAPARVSCHWLLRGLR